MNTDDSPRATNDDHREPSLRSATLSDVASRSLPRAESITAVIRHHVRADAASAYEQWLQRIVPIAERFPGHRGVHVIHPPAGSTLYTVTIRFDSLLHADDWFQSAARHALLDEVLPLLDADEEVKTVTGLEFWFHPGPGQKPARRYKQFLLTLCVIFPLTLVVPAFVHWLDAWVPVLRNAYIGHLAASAIVVASMTYVLMPRITRRLAGWLYR
ncbi:antibiotic biosynthesis monooxygenase [Variovorax sp. ZT4R33]|uniref:antibiotic biosynthesis monooxygenase n=1 Tax=Variovorax sp. ZT4R33 TaxID=3443743 RepID=UPI003F459F65